MSRRLRAGRNPKSGVLWADRRDDRRLLGLSGLFFLLGRLNAREPHGFELSLGKQIVVGHAAVFVRFHGAHISQQLRRLNIVVALPAFFRLSVLVLIAEQLLPAVEIESPSLPGIQP